ncbi:hypothetical protein ZWY2020_011949 [Hordeum vulgare]|nr:hypothetical protein ZWY2020_011949 [Hordeum vulgare]
MTPLVSGDPCQRLSGEGSAAARWPGGSAAARWPLGLRAPIGLENIDLNADSAVAASYPNMGMYTQLFHQGSAAGHGVPLQRTRSDGVAQRQGRPPRQGLPPVRAPYRRGKQVVATSGRGGAGSSRSGSGRQRHATPIMVEDVEEEDEEEEDDNMLNQHIQRPKSKANWTDRNILTLCEVACEEIDAGNYAGRVWSPQAYKNMREKY